MSHASMIQRERDAKAAKRRHDGVRESLRRHPWKAHNPGWLASDRSHPALPDKRFRVIER